MLTADTRQLDRLVAQLEAGDLDSAALVAELAEQSVRQTQARFDRREDPDGTPWPARQDNKPHPLLEETGRLRRSVRARELQNDSAVLGTAGVPYAAAHQHGYGAIPQREYAGWGDADERELQVTSRQWLERYVGELVS